MNKISSPYISLLPILFISIVMVILLSPDGFKGDEPRYVKYADNLIQGYYSPPPPNVYLLSGPGYPILLMPFAALDADYFYWRLYNVIFVYFSAVLFFYAVKYYFSSGKSLLITYITYCFVLYYHRDIASIYTESLSLLLSSALLLVFIKFTKEYEQGNYHWKLLILGAFILGYYTLTKVIFGPVIYIMIILSLLGWLVWRRAYYKMILIWSVAALLFTSPYLIYTYNLTERMFYWSNWSGDAIYWMTVPYENEVGSWMKYDPNNPRVVANHGAFYEKTSKLKGVEWDDTVKEIAIENLKNHPDRYIKNWMANVQRLFFSFPMSHKYQKLMFMFIPNMYLVVLGSIFLMLTLWWWRYIPKEILITMIFCGIYFSGTSLVSANIRQTYIMYPFIFLWLSYMISRYVKILRPVNSKSEPQYAEELYSNKGF